MQICSAKIIAETDKFFYKNTITNLQSNIVIINGKQLI
jgi:hypothetical protein